VRYVFEKDRMQGPGRPIPPCTKARGPEARATRV